MALWIGIDDTDSRKAGCTTYVAAVAMRRLEALGARLIGYPRLVRLNPNCPYKTRGNAAVAFKVEGVELEKAEDVMTGVIEELSELDEGAETSIAFLRGEPDERLRGFYWRAVRELIPLEDGFRVAEEVGAKLIYYNGGMGIIGALAAIGADLSLGKTYELIAHRRREYWGTVRRIDPVSVFDMDRATRPYTFDNIDPESGEIRIAPHTPCPVLLGIRGVNPEILEKAFKMIRIYEPIEFVTIFETNQATDVHYQKLRTSDLSDGVSAIVEGIVAEAPRIDVGGHVFFKLRDMHGEIWCAAYEPTKSFRKLILQLIPGDEIVAYGAVKQKPQGLTLNLEKIYIRVLVENIIERPPTCPDCRKRMTSMGKNKGFKCRRCGTRLPEECKEIVRVPRAIKPGFYEVPPSARRHLTRPLMLGELLRDN
ncbi:MAG: tRNA(Ile)(2)-agmatinylcytidine synthase [Aigarchaeota archaeon]|nr:tRNA(Ile)(2)-agmatinylcytidine synthase [Candidatus Wolframiiraptor gerlachensis]